MRRLLGSVLPVALLLSVLGASLAACGDDDPGAGGADAGPSASPTAGEVDFELVKTITETGAGGSVSPVAVPLSDQAAMEEFTAQFESEQMTTRVEEVAAATEVPDGMALYGAVIAIGCDAPSEVTVTSSDAGLTVTPVKVSSPKPECFAPMTTVALLLAAA